MAGLVDDAVSILTDENADLRDFGAMLHETWELKKSLASTITSPSIDQAYEACREHGAIGGKLLGAGGRGFLLIYAPPESHDDIKASIPELPAIDIQIDSPGSQIIFNDQAGR